MAKIQDNQFLKVAQTCDGSRFASIITELIEAIGYECEGMTRRQEDALDLLDRAGDQLRMAFHGPRERVAPSEPEDFAAHEMTL